MANANTVLAAVRKAVASRTTEAGERGAVQQVLARYSYFQMPAVQRMADPDRKSLRIYIWKEGLGDDDLVLVTGPSFEGKVVKGSDARLDRQGDQLVTWINGAEFVDKAMDQQLSRAIERGQDKPLSAGPKKRAAARKRRAAAHKPASRATTARMQAGFKQPVRESAQSAARRQRALRQGLEKLIESMYQDVAAGAGERSREQQSRVISMVRTGAKRKVLEAGDLGRELAGLKHEIERLDLTILRPSMAAAAPELPEVVYDEPRPRPGWMSAGEFDRIYLKTLRAIERVEESGSSPTWNIEEHIGDLEQAAGHMAGDYGEQANGLRKAYKRTMATWAATQERNREHQFALRGFMDNLPTTALLESYADEIQGYAGFYPDEVRRLGSLADEARKRGMQDVLDQLQAAARRLDAAKVEVEEHYLLTAIDDLQGYIEDADPADIEYTRRDIPPLVAELEKRLKVGLVGHAMEQRARAQLRLAEELLQGRPPAPAADEDAAMMSKFKALLAEALA